jgi:hypothetical protein
VFIRYLLVDLIHTNMAHKAWVLGLWHALSVHSCRRPETLSACRSQSYYKSTPWSVLFVLSMLIKIMNPHRDQCDVKMYFFIAPIASFTLEQRFAPSGRQPREIGRGKWIIRISALTCIDNHQATSRGRHMNKVNAIELYVIWLKLLRLKMFEYLTDR